MKEGRLSIPARLIQYALANNLDKELKFLVCLKFISCGYLPKNVTLNPKFKALIGYSSNNSVRRHLSRVIDLGWVGHDKTTGTLYPQSWAYITRITNSQSKRRFPVIPKDMVNHKVFFVSVVADLSLRSTRYYHTRKARTIRVRKGGHLTGYFAHQKDCAHQKFSVDSPLYFGLSNRKIGEMANRSQSWGSSMKKQAVALGYLSAKHRHLDLGEVHPHKALRKELTMAFPDLAGRFKLQRTGSKLTIRAQLHDEITSRLVSSRRPSIG